MFPAATKVYPSSIFVSYSKKQQYYQSTTTKSKSKSSSDDNTTATMITSTAESDKGGESVVLTVWKKSLLMNCNGFTVYDGKGNLVYRVDNYVAGGNKGEIVLMDATGKPLLTIRRKRLSLGDSWLIYDGYETSNPPKLCVRKNVHLLNSKTLAHVTAVGTTTSSSSSPKKNAVYEIEGSYAQRSVSVYNSERRCVADIQRKKAPGGISLGADVFSLIVARRTSMDNTTAMSFLIVLEQMFGSSYYSSNSRRRYSL